MANTNITPKEQELRKQASILTSIWSKFWICIAIILLIITCITANYMLGIVAAICWGMSEGEVITKEQAKEDNKQ